MPAQAGHRRGRTTMRREAPVEEGMPDEERRHQELLAALRRTPA